MSNISDIINHTNNLDELSKEEQLELSKDGKYTNIYNYTQEVINSIPIDFMLHPDMYEFLCLTLDYKKKNTPRTTDAVKKWVQTIVHNAIWTYIDLSKEKSS